MRWYTFVGSELLWFSRGAGICRPVAEGGGGAQDSGETAFVELGAGKGYLACLLAEAFPVQSLALVDCRSFRRTADRCQPSALIPVPAWFNALHTNCCSTHMHGTVHSGGLLTPCHIPVYCPCCCTAH